MVKCGIIDRKGSGSTRLILASGSRGRQEVFDRACLNYEKRASNISEVSGKTDPREYVMDLSKQKALYVSKFYKDGVIIGADSIAYINGKKLEKPRSLEEARVMMRELSGKVNQAITGVTILDLYQHKTVIFSEVTDVYFDNLSEEEIDFYINNDKFILERCGYSMNLGSLFIKRIDGDYNNVLGMPINRLYKEIRKLGYSPSDFELKRSG